MKKFTTIKSPLPDNTEVYLKVEVDMFLRNLDRKITNLCVHYNEMECYLFQNRPLDRWNGILDRLKYDLVQLYKG